jgi:hypothetical protein
MEGGKLAQYYRIIVCLTDRRLVAAIDSDRTCVRDARKALPTVALTFSPRRCRWQGLPQPVRVCDRSSTWTLAGGGSADEFDIRTWSGPGWQKGSTLLQVLISIQALILGTASPIACEPGHESDIGAS